MQSNQHSPREREIESVAVWNGGFEFSVLYFWANTKFPVTNPVYWKFPGRFSPFTRKFPSQPEFSPYLDGLVQKKRFFFLLARKLSTRHAAKMPCTHCPCFAYCNQQRCSWGYMQGIFSACSKAFASGQVYLLRQFSARADRVFAPRLLLQGRYICSGSFLPGQIEFLLQDFYIRANIYVCICSFLPRHMHLCCTVLCCVLHCASLSGYRIA